MMGCLSLFPRTLELYVYNNAMFDLRSHTHRHAGFAVTIQAARPGRISVVVSGVLGLLTAGARLLRYHIPWDLLSLFPAGRTLQIPPNMEHGEIAFDMGDT